MKKFLSITLAFAILFAVTPLTHIPARAEATSGTTGDCTWTLDGSVLTISGEGKMGDCGWNNTPYGNSFTSVIIGDRVTSIGNYAFYSCWNLTTIIIPDSVTSIGEWAFACCESLTNVYLSSNVTTIGEWAFYESAWIENVWYSGSEDDQLNIDIADQNWDLTYAIWHYNACPIGEHIYATACAARCTTCGWMNENIEDHHFSDRVCTECGFLENLAMESAHPHESNCIKTWTGTIAGAKRIAIRFSFKTKISSSYGGYITVYDGDDNIVYEHDGGENSYLAGKLVVVPSDTVKIEFFSGENHKYYGFSIIEAAAYYTDCGECQNLEVINAQTPTCKKKGFTGDTFCWDCGRYTKGEVILPTEHNFINNVCQNKGCNTTELSYSIGYNNTVAITDYNGNARILHIPSQLEGYPVTTIRDSAFSGCSSLTSVTIPNSVTNIGWHAFSSCTSLTSVTIPNSVTNIGWHAFYNCTSLTSVTIPDSVTTIEDDAFYNCGSLANITVDTNNTAYCSIDGVLFNKNKTTLIRYPAGNTASEYSIPDSVTSIGDSAFSGCSSLISVTIPDSVTSIGRDAFSYCTSLTSVTIPDSVTSIDGYSFCGCTSLTSVTIPDSVTSIGEYAFSSCDRLTTVTIPDSVTTIGRDAFSYCDSLTDIYYAGSETDRTAMTIGSPNEDLENATWHYNTCRNNAHTYSGDCDANCNNCEWVRTVSADHRFGDIRDTNCTVCSTIRTLTAFSISSAPAKLTYTCLDTALDLTGGTVLLTYDDGDSGETDLTADMVSGFDSKVAGTQTITVAYGGFVDTFEILVKPVEKAAYDGAQVSDTIDSGAAIRFGFTIGCSGVSKDENHNTLIADNAKVTIKGQVYQLLGFGTNVALNYADAYALKGKDVPAQKLYDVNEDGTVTYTVRVTNLNADGADHRDTPIYVKGYIRYLDHQGNECVYTTPVAVSCYNDVLAAADL